VSGQAARLFRLLASLKVAIPLLVLLTGVTIVGSLFPTPELFGTKWYLGLLGILGLSLLLITIQHAPLILKKKGRNAMIGVITTHLGILVVIAGVIYGGFSGFRHEIKLIEGEVTIVPGLPFAIRLDELVVEEYDPQDFPTVNVSALPKKQQDSRITLLKGGKEWMVMIAAPGDPARIDGITLLPGIGDVGWVYDLIVTDAIGREKTVPVRPWALPVITLGGRQVMAHGRGRSGEQEVEILERDGGQIVSLGMVTRDEPLLVDGATRPIDVASVALGAVRKYTGAQVYNRPQEPILIWGSVLMFAGLVWHFYFRHRDRRREGRRDA
jgi:cytochrome c biogenesis protein ResB